MFFFLQIAAGKIFRTKKEKTEQIRKVKSKHVHPKFDLFKFINDMALLVLEEELEFNEFVGPVELPRRHEEFSGSARVSGWGTITNSEYKPSENLLKVTVPLVSSNDCYKDYEHNVDKYDPRSMICAGTTDKGSSTGDSGGPLICGSKLCGIVSWGSECATEECPGVYTRVTTYVDFIKNGSISP